MEHQLLIGEELMRFLVVLASLTFVHSVLSKICILVHWKDGRSAGRLLRIAEKKCQFFVLQYK